MTIIRFVGQWGDRTATLGELPAAPDLEVGEEVVLNLDRDTGRRAVDELLTPTGRVVRLQLHQR